ncbi:MAG: hypothetical protein ACI875_001668 [Planctomycetota bacterium]|jgi:hypothetical protein
MDYGFLRILSAAQRQSLSGLQKKTLPGSAAELKQGALPGFDTARSERQE